MYKKFLQVALPLVCAAAVTPVMATNAYVTAPSSYGSASIKLNGISHNNVGTTTIGLNYGGASFEAFCMELEQSVSPGTTVNYSISSYVNDGIARLFTAAGFNGAKSGSDSVTTVNQRSALQLAVWEIVYDGLGGSFDTGRFSVVSTSTAKALQLARGYLEAAAATVPGRRLQRYSNAYSQDLVTAVEEIDTTAVSAVPEPETALMWLGGVAALLAAARRRKQRSTSAA